MNTSHAMTRRTGQNHSRPDLAPAHLATSLSAKSSGTARTSLPACTGCTTQAALRRALHIHALPCPATPYRAKPYRKDLQASRLESPETWTPVAKTDKRTGDIEPTGNRGGVDNGILILHGTRQRPLVENGTGTDDTGRLNANRHGQAESFILPEFIIRARAIVLKRRIAHREEVDIST